MNDNDEVVLAEVEHQIYRELLAAAMADELKDDDTSVPIMKRGTPNPNLNQPKKETSR